MFYRYLTILFLILTGIPVNHGLSQVLRYRSDMITRDDGLSNSSVSCLIRDKYDFIWIGTWNGLNRYDGYDMTSFQSDPEDSTSISNNNINLLFEDREGLLWIATDNGLNSYDQISGKFKRYFFHRTFSSDQVNNQINGITQDARGLLWVGCQEGGLISLNKYTGTYKRYSNPYSESSNTVITVHADILNENYIWTGTADGLFRYNRETHSYERIASSFTETSLSVQVIKQDSQGNLFLGTWGNGLIRYDRKTARLSPCVSDDIIGGSIRNSIVRTMSFDSNDNLIFSVRDRGLMSYDLTSGQINEFNADDVNNDLNNKSVTSIFIEPSGILWVGTSYDGVIKIVSLINSFKHFSTYSNVKGAWNGGGVTSILEDSEGLLWLGTRFGGLYSIDRKTQKYTWYKQNAGGLGSNNILSMLEVVGKNQRRIWIGTDGGGLNCLDPETGKIIVYKITSNECRGPVSGSISSIIQYDSDHLIIGTRNRNLGEGLYVFGIKSGKFVNFRYDPKDSSSLGSNNILKLFKDKGGTVWVGTRNGGLNKFVIRNIEASEPSRIGYFERYTHDPDNPRSLKNNTVYSIHDDSNHNLWLGTNDGGLSKFEPSTGTFTANVFHQYLKDQLIFGILADDNKNLWISTSRGIITLNLSTSELHSFDKFDGLQESAFIYGSYFKSSSGELFFGGIKGCNSFHPDSIRINLKVPEIVITSFMLGGKKGTMPVTALTGKSVLASDTVQFPYNQNNFSISFSALDYNMPARNRFRYRLIGYDKDWIETDAKRRYVNYTNLPPGRYTFKVKGSNSDDIWNQTGTSVYIHILPPLWRTTMFYIFMLIVLTGIASFIFYLILKKYRHEKKQLELEALSSVQDERKQLRTLIDNIPDLIFIKDRECRFTLANTKVATVMNTTPENLIGKTDFDFYTYETARKFYIDEQNIMETGTPMIHCEENAHDELGNRIIRSTTKVPVRNNDGVIIGIAGVCRDITKLKKIENQLRKKSEDLQETNNLLEGRQKEILMQSEELAAQTQNLLMINAELERLNRTKDKFFSIIAHDLRNPFNAIIGFTELLRNDFNEMDNPQKLNILELINVSSQTAYNLLENLLQWARTQTDKINYNPENFDLSESARMVADLHCVIARKKGVKVKNQVEENTRVFADKNMINAVLRNLVSNAIKFSNPNGEIIISVKHKSDMVEVNVTDDGIGMDRDSLSKLFRIDTYYSTSGTMGESGTGLGLIICKEFIEKNNGRIKATSTEGEGTNVSFTLNPAGMN